jgi:uncharacterized protein (TIGR02118 family)
MIKFMVVLVRRGDLDVAGFERYLAEVHGPLAEALPGLRGYSQNLVAPDPKRPRPAWDAIAELWFDDRAAMEAAWNSPAGAAASEDLARFADLERTTWSVAEAVERRPLEAKRDRANRSSRGRRPRS